MASPKNLNEMGTTADGKDVWFRHNPNVKKGNVRLQGETYSERSLDVLRLLTMPGAMDAIDKDLESLQEEPEEPEPEPESEPSTEPKS